MAADKITTPSGHTLTITRAGTQGPSVVLVHGWTCRRSDWNPTLNALQDDFRLTAIDLPGHGDSRGETVDSWSISSLAGALAEAVNELGQPDAILVGHSMGGAVALEAARRLDSVKGVVLVDTFVIPYGDLAAEQARDIAQPFHDDFPGAIDGLVENFTGNGASDADKQRMKMEMADADPAKMLPLWSDLLQWTPEAAFNGIRAPIHAINGDMIPDAARKRCENRVTEHRLEGAGHFLQVEVPDRFHDCLGEVLKKIN